MDKNRLFTLIIISLLLSIGVFMTTISFRDNLETIIDRDYVLEAGEEQKHVYYYFNISGTLTFDIDIETEVQGTPVLSIYISILNDEDIGFPISIFDLSQDGSISLDLEERRYQILFHFYSLNFSYFDSTLNDDVLYHITAKVI